MCCLVFNVFLSAGQHAGIAFTQCGPKMGFSPHIAPINVKFGTLTGAEM